jgi:hypothetical protein
MMAINHINKSDCRVPNAGARLVAIVELRDPQVYSDAAFFLSGAAPAAVGRRPRDARAGKPW